MANRDEVREVDRERGAIAFTLGDVERGILRHSSTATQRVCPGLLERSRRVSGVVVASGDGS